MKKINLVNSRTVFFSTLIVSSTIILIVYLTGLADHRSLYQNSLITTTVLSAVFFCFITTGLYRGWKLKDTLGDLTRYFSKLKKPEKSNADAFNLEGIGGFDADLTPEGCLFAIILWILVGLFGTIIFWAIGAFFWGIILVLGGLLYWIIFRAFRLILKNSTLCKGDILRSVQIALIYSLLYSSWIYAILFFSHYFSL
ncbi:MAG: hypothetical protein IPI66_12555 [Chitinophagaceae bacterium]|nr:hypothetical protein [Chitinophagaceae bacterium]MBL0056391.1 hypothetical protein [Chitinophagaceae bacterium]